MSAASCASVDNWSSAMAGHAATSTSFHPRPVAAADYRDCNANVLDGRETDVSASEAHCGACGARCDGTCDGGRCSKKIAPSASGDPSQQTDWRAPTKPLSRAGPTDVSAFGGHGEISLLAFEFDSDPVESWRYDACVASGECTARALAQPAGDGPSSPAVGMRWQDAEAFCKQRGMSAQTPVQDRAIRDTGAGSLGPNRFDASLAERDVIAGFRCARALGSQ